MSMTNIPEEKIPRCYAGEPVVEERFFAPLGRSIKFWTIYAPNFDSIKKSKEEEDDDDESPRILYESGCIWWVNPNKTVQITSPPPRETKSEGLDDEQRCSSLASCIEEITKHVELLKEELVKPYTSRHCLKWADLLFSWIPKTGALPPYEQVSGECWAAALQRGRAYYMAANGINGKELTIKDLLDGVSRKHLKISGGLVRLEAAKKFLVANGYVKDMIVHRRPDEYAGYEILLEKLLARGPVVVVYNTLPGYNDYKGKGIYIPDEKICQVSAFERFKQHSVVVTGCGVGLVQEEPVEFWQTHDSQEPTWGVNGFGQLARRYGLIVAAVEFEF